MKVKNSITSIEIEKEEWKKVWKEWEKIKYADKPILFKLTDSKYLYEFMEYINSVANNPAHSIDQKLNSH